MIWYVLGSGILLYCLEIIGRYVLSFLNIDKFKCCFGIGLIVFLTYSYVTTSLITALNGSFYVIGVLYSLFFIIFLFLIIRDRKKISFKIDLINLIVLIGFVTIMLLYAYNTTLGELNGFDSTYYLNLVTSNIKSSHMNLSYYSNSVTKSFINKQYTFQTYYYVASFISYVFTSIINIFHKTYYQTAYIWVFQILFNAFYYSLIINSINMMKNKNNIIKILLLIFFILTYGRVYYYSVFGFYGNTYRIITVGYSTLLLYLLVNFEKNNYLMMLFIMSLLASASVSSSSLFIDIFILYGSYFILSQKYNNILKIYSIPLLFVLINLFVITFNINILYSILYSLTISLLLFIFGERINTIFSKKAVLFIIFLLSFLFMFISSLLITNNLFDFSAFLHNHSEAGDMTINYFNLSSFNNLLYLKIFILGLLISSLFSIKKEQFIMFTSILFICLFNPFCCPFLYKVLIVYFRAFDIIVNPFTIVLYIDYLLGYFKNKSIIKLLVYVFIVLVFVRNNPLKPLYYSDFFEPGYDKAGLHYSNYNNEFKMSQDEKDTIDIIYEDCIYYDKQEPYVITPSLLMHGFIPNGRYMYGREYWNQVYESNSEKQLFAIFFPERYLGEHVEGITPDFYNIDKYIKEAEVDYLVVDKTKEYYDEITRDYSYLYIKVSELFYPMFENDRYVVYRCFYQ